MKTKISQSRLAGISKILNSATGLFFPEERSGMLVRSLTLAAVEMGFTSYDQFADWLLSSNLTREELKKIAGFLTISETYFWREEPVFNALVNNIIPKIISEKASFDKKIKIWSAGCATGEEAYSLAIALHRSIPTIEEWKISVIGTDLNSKSLDKAKSGIYGKWSFRNCPTWLKSNYFRSLGDSTFEVLPAIRKMVSFHELNLTDPVYPSFTEPTDILFCRNVLMYLSDDWIEKIAARFYSALQPSGWFIVSSCELSSSRFQQFSVVNFPGAIIYSKSQNSDQSNTELAAKENYVVKNRLSTTDKLEFRPSNKVKTIEHVTQTSDTAESLANQVNLLSSEGKMEEAILLCSQAIASDKINKELYFIKSSLLQEAGRDEEAIGILLKALFLDPKFSLAHLTLGNLYQKKGEHKKAKKHFENAQQILMTSPNEDIIPFSGGISVETMKEMITKNKLIPE